MAYTKGQRVVVVHDWSRLTDVREGTISVDATESAEYVNVDGQMLVGAYVFPLSAKQDILQVVHERARLKAAYDDSMKLVYEVCNKKSRREYA